MDTLDSLDLAVTGDSVTDAILLWFRANLGKIVWLLLVFAVAFAADRLLRRVVRGILDRSQIPSASIFINISRVMVWCLAAATVLQPVFGINPSTLVTALGVTGVAISLGMKDSVANVIGGFGLMFGHVIQPGDPVTIQSVTGVVRDITWRQTMIETRAGDHMVIPNSILNTASLTKLTPVNESLTTVPFTARMTATPDEVTRDVVARVSREAADVMTDASPIVKFTGFSPYGMEGQILVFAREGVLTSTVRDRAARAVAGAPWLVDCGSMPSEGDPLD